MNPANTILLKVFKFKEDTSQQKILSMNVIDRARKDMENGIF